jgi:hypothetical protein
MITHVKYSYDKKRLKSEALTSEGYEPYYDPVSKRHISVWKISKDIGKYGSEISQEFEHLLECSVSPRYYLLQKGVTLPFHKDRGTRCCINFVLSDARDPIEFKTGKYSYECALVNVQEDHQVTAAAEDRILFKLSIFDIDYDEARKMLDDKLSSP